MRILVIGGNRFVGLELVTRLLLDGHQVTTLNRGHGESPFGHLVNRLVCDRDTPQFEKILSPHQFDAVVDFALFTKEQAQRTVRALAGRCAHYVMISTGQVFLVKKSVPRPALETDFEGELMSPPKRAFDLEQWQYGVDKRGAEEVVALSDFPTTRIRIPMVHGLRDYKRRIESLLWRFLDGAPILISQPEAACRHVFSSDVVQALMVVLRAGPQREVFHVSQAESISTRQLVETVARCAEAKCTINTIDAQQMEQAGLDVSLACAFNSQWMSELSPEKILSALGFRPRSFEENLQHVVRATLERLSVPPPSMMQRPLEIEFANGGL
jgi:nucleoside-diphosphate-sugar epimerase